MIYLVHRRSPRPGERLLAFEDSEIERALAALAKAERAALRRGGAEVVLLQASSPADLRLRYSGLFRPYQELVDDVVELLAEST